MATPKRRVYITDFIGGDLETEIRILGDLAEVEALGAQNEDQLRGRLEDAACLMVYHFLGLSAATIQTLNKCKVIVRCGVGVDNVDRVAARKIGIPVCNVPDYGTEDVADTAIGIMLALTRGTHLLNSRLRAGKGPWSYTQAAPLYRLRGRTFGVIGMGRIGTAASHRAKALGMDVVFYDPYVPDGWERAHGVRRVEHFNELLAQSHVLSLHCPATPETIRMIGAAQIALMPRGSFLINTARGALLDTRSIPPAIRSGQLAGAGIDVLPVEPPAVDDSLIKAWRDPQDPCHERVMIAPHAAFYCEEGLQDIRVKAAETCRRALLGQSLRNVVN
ncbi:MAG TPA: C-terminal binding protein [Candidatus Dormibacteraeota bacterium]|nr:C-terminal binding protein [Candidatus Dormibacteraeota bacterium]